MIDWTKNRFNKWLIEKNDGLKKCWIKEMMDQRNDGLKKWFFVSFISIFIRLNF